MLQFLLDLSDLQVAEAVRCRFDFHHSVLADFRGRLVQGRADRRGTRQSRRRPVPGPDSGAKRERSHLSSVLFGGVQSFKPSGAVGAGDLVRPLLTAIDRAVAEFVLDGEATAIAVSLWVTLHGLVTLELAGALDASGAHADRRSSQ
ncbi:TetR-like C-terminal domain-containing protein [Streptomyces mirabilis]|uniref:TetR-like C-terminal domain-containing protein n=1 Tax=Streptomyces mirabilis TaxID=68239 RepID=UPI0037190916